MDLLVVTDTSQQVTSTISYPMKSQSELSEARLERLILVAAASCVAAMLYLLITSLVS